MWLHSGLFIFSIDYSIAYFVFLFACWHRCWLHFILWSVHSFASLCKSFDLWLKLPLINNLCLFLRWMRPAETIVRRFFFHLILTLFFIGCVSFFVLEILLQWVDGGRCWRMLRKKRYWTIKLFTRVILYFILWMLFNWHSFGS